MTDAPRLRRVLGLPSLTFYGVGLILGAGIYSLVGAAAGEAGNGLWLAFLVAAFIALLTGLSYAELSTMYPRAAAEFEFARHAFPRSGPLAAGTGMLLAASGTATAATVSRAFAGYLQQFVDVPVAAAAVALLLAAAAINLTGIRHAAWANIAMTLVEVAGLILVVAVGVREPDFTQSIRSAPPAALMSAAALIFFAFLGFEDIANLAEESREPRRQVPRAILLSVAIATVLYVLVAMAALALAPADELAASKAPLADAIATVDPRLGGVLAGIALFATANTCLVAMVAASRMLFGLGRAKEAPPALDRVGKKRGTPWIAALVILAGALALLPLGSTAVLGGVASLAALLAFAVVNASVVALRITEPKKERSFRVPFAVGRVPILPIVGALAALACASQLSVEALAIGVPVVAWVFGMVAIGRAMPG